MGTLVINANSIYDRVIKIGRQTENLVSEITFNVNMWIEEYGAGECVLNVKRSGDGNAYPVPMTIVDGLATWTITDTDTAKKGRGEIQLKYTADNKVKTSPVFTISCGESLIGDGEPPSGYEDWLAELGDMTVQVEAARTAADASAQTAQTAAQTATEKASEAEQSAITASRFASNASASAQSANTSAQAAAQSAEQAAESVSDADASAQAASQSAQSAEAAKTAAQTAESNAHTSEQTASEKASEAAESAAQAQASADRANVDILRFLPTDSASGAVASFPDGADDIPVKSFVVGIEPVQDLHGYDSPWPAGGGKNIANPQNSSNPNRASFTYSEKNEFVVAGTKTDTGGKFFAKYTIPVEAESEYVFSFETFKIDGTDSSVQVYIYEDDLWGIGVTSFSISATTKTRTWASTRTGTVTVGIYISNGDTGKSLLLSKFMIRPSTKTDATFAPYSNICPITGWTGVKIEKRGKNLWDEEWEVGGINTSGIPYSITTRIRSKNYINVPNGAKLYFKSPVQLCVCQYDINKNFLQLNGVTNTALTVRDDCYYLLLATNVDSYGTTYNNDISINYPATDIEYHPYSGESVNISFSTEAGTVYGGSLDVTNGVLTVDKKRVTISSSEIKSTTTTGRFFCDIGASGEYVVDNGNVVNAFIYSQTSAISAGKCYMQSGFRVQMQTNYPSLEAFISALNGNDLEFCFMLATPIAYQLTPAEVKSLLGQNNIWADTGDTSVTYRADIQRYIQKMLSQ